MLSGQTPHQLWPQSADDHIVFSDHNKTLLHHQSLFFTCAEKNTPPYVCLYVHTHTHTLCPADYTWYMQAGGNLNSGPNCNIPLLTSVCVSPAGAYRVCTSSISCVWISGSSPTRSAPSAEWTLRRSCPLRVDAVFLTTPLLKNLFWDHINFLFSTAVNQRWHEHTCAALLQEYKKIWQKSIEPRVPATTYYYNS